MLLPPVPDLVYVSAPPAPPAERPVEAAPTPAAYQVLSERERNIQQRLIEIPTIQPMEMNEVNAEWARQQYRMEHPEVSR